MMAQSQFQRLKHCNQVDKDVVHGYVKKMQSMLLHHKNPYYIVGKLIRNLILLYFHKMIDFQILRDDEQSKLY